MRLISLKMENFRQHCNSHIEFSEGITIINGVNGSGKSTVLEAICWAIYGNDAARGTRDSIKWNKAKARTKVLVEVVFQLEKEIYKVKRYLDRAEVYLGRVDTPIVNSQTEVTKYLVEKIGMTKNEFFNTYFTGQKELSFLSNVKSATERRNFISKVLNYEKIGDALKKIREDKNNLKREIEGFKLGLQDANVIEEEKKKHQEALDNSKKQLEATQKEFTDISKQLAEIEPEWEKSKKVKDEFDKLTREQEATGQKLKYVSENLKKLDLEFKDLEEKNKKYTELKEYEFKYKDIEKQLKEQEKLQAHEITKQTLISKLEGLEKDSGKLNEEIKAVIESGKSKKEQVDKISDLKKDIELLNKKIQDLAARQQAAMREKEVLISQKQKEFQKINKQQKLIEDKGESGACPTCERPLKNEFKKVISDFEINKIAIDNDIKALTNELNELKIIPTVSEELNKQKQLKEKEYSDFIKVQGEYKAEQDRYKKVKKELDINKSEVEKIKKTLSELPSGYDKELMEKLRVEIKPLREKYEELISLKETVAKLEAVKKDLSEHKKSLDDAQKVYDENEEKIKKLEFSPESFKQAEEKFLKVKDGFYNAQNSIVKSEAEVKNAQNNLENCLKHEQEYKKKLEAIKNKEVEHNYLIELDRFYGKFLEKLNNLARPELSYIASDFLKELTDDRYSQLELNDKYEINLYDEGEIKPVISGGEEDVANLCLRLAISKMIAQRTGRSLSLLILDEVFGSLDENRRNNVVNLLNRLSHSFEQVILITHIEDIKESIDNVIKVEYDEEQGCSIISTSAYKFSAMAELASV